jgi:ELP3 family radical SAM enzyme/protein acetyltransferase
MQDIEDLESKESISPFVNELIANCENKSKEQIESVFMNLKRKFRMTVSKSDVRRCFHKEYSSEIQSIVPPMFKKWLIKNATRTDSGVLVVTITLSPHKFSCKYNCGMCPQETDLNGVPTQPRSYLSSEPAMLRALGTRKDMNSYDFDVRNQFLNRIKAYKYNGCMSEGCKKIEVILSGGTWESYPETYRDQVIQELYWSANTCESDTPRQVNTLAEEIKENETTEYRIIGLTLETRPDNITKANILNYLRYGVTRIQIGEQTDNDEILEKINRRCYKRHSIEAHRLLKQAGLKVVVHLMPDLPGSSPEKDIEMFDHYLNDPDLQFDDVKIYPTAVCKSSDPERIVHSKIAEWYDQGLYKPYAETNLDDLYRVLIYYKTRVKPWVRIQRVVRDIPGKSIESGYKKISNLRQILHQKMKAQSPALVCKCIYCMEIGDMELMAYKPLLVLRSYKASGGLEYHLSVEAHKMSFYRMFLYYVCLIIVFVRWIMNDKADMPLVWGGDMKSYVGLYGFLRLRIDPAPGGDFVPEINGCALIREVHVYGQSMGVQSTEVQGMKSIGSQHRGHGRLMVATAEMIALAHGLTKTAVIAGVGTREYYKNKCGYTLDTHYMKKNLETNMLRREALILIQLLLLLACVRMLRTP